MIGNAGLEPAEAKHLMDEALSAIERDDENEA